MPTLAPARYDLIGANAIQQGVDWTWPIRVEVNALPAPPFVASTPYVLGNYVTPTVATGFTYVCVVAGTAGTEPTWPTVKGGRVTSTGATFMAIGSTRMIVPTTDSGRMHIRQYYGDPNAEVVASVGTGTVFVSFDPATWTVNTAKALGNQVMSTTQNGWVYQCVVAGTTHATTEPVWPTTLGQTVTDGTVTWRNVSTDAGASNFRIQFTAAQTAAFVAFGLGIYDVEYYDAFGLTTRIVEGLAELSQEVTVV